MLKENQFEAKVISVTPFAQYNGITYDQTIVVELLNKQKIKMFDSRLAVKKEFEGKRVLFTVGLLSPKWIIQKKEEYKITQKAGHNLAVQGKIISFKKQKGLLDAKSAIFEIDSDSEDSLNGKFVETSTEGTQCAVYTCTEI